MGGVRADEPCPLPDDPLLNDAALAMCQTGQAAWIVDDQWNYVFATDDARLLWADRDGGQLGSVAVGHHLFSTEALEVAANWRFGITTKELWRDLLNSIGGLVLADTPGGRQAMRAAVDPSLRDEIDDIEPNRAEVAGFPLTTIGLHGRLNALMVATKIRDDRGRVHGTLLIGKPTAPMSVLGGMAWERDLDHLQRMEHFTRAGRYPTAILFADLERSSDLVRSLSTAAYFTIGRRLVRQFDRCVLEAGGLVGRHLGDGVVAYFPAVTSGSESRAARTCIQAARAMRCAIADVAARSELPPDGLIVRFGLHWGSTVYIGKISTSARAEVTALGDEVNVAARIEASATGGRMLASKPLIERLDADDADALDIDTAHVLYTQLGNLDTATDKARRDAFGLSVCEL